MPLNYTRPMAAGYIRTIAAERPEEVSWAIEREGRYAGTIDLRVRGGVEAPGAGSLGFATHQDARGRGVMSEAVGLVLGHAFGALGWELVQWQANVGNYGSYKAVWRNGFPLPVMVTALLDHRGVLTDGWQSTLWREDPREPVVTWEEAYAVLRQ